MAGDRFEELRQLCTAAEDKASLAIGMAGLVMDHGYHDRVREASQLASEAMALIESVGDPTLTVGLSMPLIYAKGESAEWCDVLRWSQRAIDLADGDPSKGNFIVGSPLALAFTTRGMARYWLGRAGWRDDLRHGLAMARSADPMSYATVVAYAYILGIPMGVLRSDDSVLREIEDALRIAERSGDDLALAFSRVTLGVALVHRQTAAERDRGQKLLAEVSDVFLRQGHNLSELPLLNVYVARERARRGDRDDALPVMRAAVDHLFREGQLLEWGIPATGVLVETLLDRGADGDVAEAEAAIERLAAAPADDGLVIREIWLLRLRALLAKAHGDDAAYRDYRDRYRDDGDIAWLRGAHRVGRGDAMTAAAPSGVVTFLFTDVEGSTRRWEADADAMRTALAAHDEVLRTAIEAHGGYLFNHTGDGVCRGVLLTEVRCRCCGRRAAGTGVAGADGAGDR